MGWSAESEKELGVTRSKRNITCNFLCGIFFTHKMVVNLNIIWTSPEKIPSHVIIVNQILYKAHGC